MVISMSYGCSISWLVPRAAALDVGDDDDDGDDGDGDNIVGMMTVQFDSPPA